MMAAATAVQVQASVTDWVAVLTVLIPMVGGVLILLIKQVGTLRDTLQTVINTHQSVLQVQQKVNGELLPTVKQAVKESIRENVRPAGAAGSADPGVGHGLEQQ